MRIAFFSTILVSLLAGAAQAAVLEEFKAEDWNGMAYADDETGRLANCSVYAAYENGVTLYFFNHPDGSWMVGLDSEAWKLTQDQPYEISYQVDRNSTNRGSAVALSNTLLGISLPAEAALIRDVRGGNELTVTFDGTDYRFDLGNSGTALDAAEDCVSRHAATAVAQNEPEAADGAAAGPDATSAEPDPSAQTDAAQTEGTSTDDAAAQEGAAAADTTSGSEASTAGERQEFGPWVVTATDDGSGNFVNCTAFGVHGDDQLIISHYPSDRWEFGLYRGAWALDTNQTYYLWYNVDAPVDGPGVIKRPVEAVEPTRIFFEVSDLDDIISRMENGTTLNLQLRGFSGEPENLSYPLDRAAEAFAAARACTEQRLQQTAAGQQSSGAGGETTAGELPPIGNETIEEIQVPGWQAGAYGDAGSFTHCAIRAEYDNGTTLGVARTAGGALLLALHRTDWSLEPGVQLSGSVTIGDADKVEKTGRAVDGAMAVLDLGGDADTTAALASANTLAVETQGKTLDFDISDIGPGIEAIDACAERHAQSGTETEPARKRQSGAAEQEQTGEAEQDAAPAEQEQASAPEAQSEAAAPSPAALSAEAAGYTTALLIRSGYPGHVMLTGDDVPESMRDRNAAWQIGEIMGITDIVTGSLEEIRSAVAESDTADCKGNLTTGVKGENEAHSHFFSACDASDTDLFVHYVLVPRQDGGSYMLTFIGLGDGAAAEAIADKVYRTATGS